MSVKICKLRVIRFHMADTQKSDSRLVESEGGFTFVILDIMADKSNRANSMDDPNSV